ncbi:MAG: hypothetical protein Q7R56_03400 [Nanoarchaeota archaeon]|nr:hypothetical protein [Nanoarchaeota archaeon]
MNNYTTHSSTYNTNTYQNSSLPIVYPTVKAANKRTDYKCKGTCSSYNLCTCGRN